MIGTGRDRQPVTGLLQVTQALKDSRPSPISCSKGRIARFSRPTPGPAKQEHRDRRPPIAPQPAFPPPPKAAPSSQDENRLLSSQSKSDLSIPYGLPEFVC
jgi:hypothetical protein